MESFAVDVTKETIRKAIDWMEPEGAPEDVAAFFEQLMYQSDLAQAEAPSRVVINITE